MADAYGETPRSNGQGGEGLAVVTGGSSGIGLELAKLAAKDGYSLLIAADTKLDEAQRELSALGTPVEAIEADLSTKAGVDALEQAIAGRDVALLFANAGHGLGEAFLDQDFAAIQRVIDTNVTGTLDILQRIARRMRDANAGRILITGSIAGVMPGAYQAVYNGTKAFIDSFAFALRNELKDSNVTVSLLMPGPTDTDFFERAGMADDTPVGKGKKQDPAEVAESGYKAMMKGEDHVVAGWQNKLQAYIAQVTPSTVLAEMHRKMAEPEHARK